MNGLCHWVRLTQTQAHPQITQPRLVPHCLSWPSPALPLSPTYSSAFPTASSILTPFVDRLACRHKLGTCHTPTTFVPSHTLCSPRVAGLLARKLRSWLMPAGGAGPQCRHQSFLLATVCDWDRFAQNPVVVVPEDSCEVPMADVQSDLSLGNASKNTFSLVPGVRRTKKASGLSLA